MRKGFISVLMIPLLLLAGCGEREAKLEKTFEDFRAALNGAAAVTARAELVADYGETAERYTLDVTYDGSETVVEIVQPELLAGIRATVRWGEASISYDGVMLGAGPVDGEGLTPVAAVPAILAAMAGGYTELRWWDGDLAAVRLYVGEGSACTVWLEPDGLTPVAAEISSGGRRAVSCTFEDWRLEPG